MALVSQREYARRRGISLEAVRKRTVKYGGPIPTHGRAQQIDPDEADRLWRATMQPNGAASSRFQGPPEPDAPAGDGLGGAAAFLGNVHALTQARTATMLVEAQLRRLRLEERRGQLLDRQTTLAKVFTVLRSVRDAWLAWPARVGPELAAELGVDPTTLMITLEPYVRRQLDELAGVRLELGGRRPGS
jgi:hypothetical protein